MLRKSVLFSCCCKKRHQQCCLWGWSEEEDTFYSATWNLNLRERFSFLVPSQSNGISHTTVDENPHLKFDSLMVLEAALTHLPVPISCARRGHTVLVLASSQGQHGKQPVILLWTGGGSWGNVTVFLYFHLYCSSRCLAEFACTAYGYQRLCFYFTECFHKETKSTARFLNSFRKLRCMNFFWPHHIHIHDFEELII